MRADKYVAFVVAYSELAVLLEHLVELLIGIADLVRVVFEPFLVG